MNDRRSESGLLPSVSAAHGRVADYLERSAACLAASPGDDPKIGPLDALLTTLYLDFRAERIAVHDLAAGFDGGGPTKRQDDRALGQVLGQTTIQRPQATPAQNNHHVAPTSVPTTPAPQPTRAPAQAEPVHVPVQAQPQATPSYQPVNHHAPLHPTASPVSGHAQQLPTQQPPRQPTFEDSDDLDVPDFLK